MDKLSRRAFLRMGAGLAGAAALSRTVFPLFAEKETEEWTPPESARVSFLRGELLVNGASADLGDVLKQGDRLETLARSEAEIEVRDYALFQIKANTVVDLDDILGTPDIKVRKGWFLIIVKKMKVMNVSTPMVLAGVRGTVLFFNVLDDRKMYMCDCNGTVDLSDASTGQKLKTVTSYYHKPFNFRLGKDGLKMTPAGMLYHDNRDILEMSDRFPVETKMFEGKY